MFSTPTLGAVFTPSTLMIADNKIDVSNVFPRTTSYKSPIKIGVCGIDIFASEYFQLVSEE